MDSEMTHASHLAAPSPEKILQAFQELGTQSSVAIFFGVSRRTVERWLAKYDLQPETRPEIPISQLLSIILADPVVRARIAQWIVDEASISIAYNARFDTSTLIVVGAMNDSRAMGLIADVLEVAVTPGAEPQEGRLPMHIVKVQGARAYCLLRMLSEELIGLKALEAEAALSFFPKTGVVKGKVTTDLYMNNAWREFATESVEKWNKKKRIARSSERERSIVEAWMKNRMSRARRGLGREVDDRKSGSTSAPSSP
jgi:hypothetical protein